MNVRPIRGEDFAQWRVLYRGYADFYKAKQSDEMAAQVWSWLQDPEHEVQGLVVEGGAGKPVGLAPHRPFARPLSASVGCYLDDLFVDPTRRGGGAADLLLRELARPPGENGRGAGPGVT